MIKGKVIISNKGGSLSEIILNRQCPDIEWKIFSSLPSCLQAFNTVSPDIILMDFRLDTNQEVDYLSDFKDLFLRMKTRRLHLLLSCPRLLINIQKAGGEGKSQLHLVQPDISANQFLDILTATAIVIKKEKGTKSNVLILCNEKSEQVEVHPDEILYLEAAGAYTYVNLRNSKRIMIARHLKSFMPVLEQHRFYRTHRKVIIKVDEALSYEYQEGADGRKHFLVMSCGRRLPLSKRNYSPFFKYLRSLGHHLVGNLPL